MLTAEVGSRYKKVPTVPLLGTFLESTGLLCRYSVLGTFQIDITAGYRIEALYARTCMECLHYVLKSFKHD